MRATAAVVVVLAGGLAAPAAAAPVAVHARVTPPSVFFGDAFTYTVEAEVDGSQVDPGDVQVIADTGVFTLLGESTTSRTRGAGGSVVVRLSQHLACLDAACVPSGSTRRVWLPPPRALGPLGLQIRGSQVLVGVAQRVPTAAVRARTAEFRRETAIPSAGTRVPASDVELALWLASAALGMLAAAVGALELRRRAQRAQTSDRMARAVRLLRESALRPVEDRRRAADLVARELAERGAAPLSGSATELAWSAHQPAEGDALSFADKVERATGAAR
jgi:hypothetical protein